MLCHMFSYIGEGGLQSLLGNMSHNQLMQLIGPTGLGGIGAYENMTEAASTHDVMYLI